MSVPHPLGRRALATALAAAVALLPTYAFAQRGGRGANNPIRNIAVVSAEESPNAFEGTFSIQRFQLVENTNTIVAVGELTGRLGDGTPVNHQSVAWPVSSVTKNGVTGSLQDKAKTVPATWDMANRPSIVPAQAACDVLNLDLGPLHLDLLGLVVDLAPVHLDITAQPGAGNLLGNLLCGILGALDPLGALAALTQSLNNLANALNGLIDALP